MRPHCDQNCETQINKYVFFLILSRPKMASDFTIVWHIYEAGCHRCSNIWWPGLPGFWYSGWLVDTEVFSRFYCDKQINEITSWLSDVLSWWGRKNTTTPSRLGSEALGATMPLTRQTPTSNVYYLLYSITPPFEIFTSIIVFFSSKSLL